MFSNISIICIYDFIFIFFFLSFFLVSHRFYFFSFYTIDTFLESYPYFNICIFSLKMTE